MTARAMLLSDEETKDAANLHQMGVQLIHKTREAWANTSASSFKSGAQFARTLYEAERNRLLDEIEKLEAMVPKWVPVAQKIALDIQGWLPLEDQKCGDDERLWLMVPPIPLPEKHEEKGREIG